MICRKLQSPHQHQNPSTHSKKKKNVIHFTGSKSKTLDIVREQMTQTANWRFFLLITISKWVLCGTWDIEQFIDREMKERERHWHLPTDRRVGLESRLQPWLRGILLRRWEPGAALTRWAPVLSVLKAVLANTRPGEPEREPAEEREEGSVKQIWTFLH